MEKDNRTTGERRGTMGRSQSPDRTSDRRPASRKKKKKRRVTPFQLLIALLIAILLVVAAVVAFFLLVPRSTANAGEEGQKTAIFGIDSIEVVGDTRYTEEEIIGAGGLYVGQSIFSISKKQAAESILASFPYIETVTVESPSFHEIRITVTEVEVLGVLADENGWLVLGANNKILESLPASDTVPVGYLVIQGPALNHAVSQAAMDDTVFQTLEGLLNGIEKSGLSDITLIDINDSSDLRLSYKGQITLLLGSDINLDEALNMAQSSLEQILKSRGEDATGQLDLRTYADSNSENDMAVFTPQELLDKAA